MITINTNNPSGFDLLYGTPYDLQFIRKLFDFTINPAHFIEWLKAEGEDCSRNYAYNVTSMCEYSCLYVSMMFYKMKLKGELSIYYGEFGFFEHYWIGYKVDGVEYFIDLTLQQFIKTAPKVAVLVAINQKQNGCYNYLSEGTPIADYADEKRAFEFYTNPVNMKPPPIQSRFELKSITHNL